jgi:hypothetical protein
LLAREGGDNADGGNNRYNKEFLEEDSEEFREENEEA